MPGEDWVKARVAAAKTRCPKIADAVVALAEEMLNGPLSKRSLRPVESLDAAKALLVAAQSGISKTGSAT